jgi:hypothetical protein
MARNNPQDGSTSNSLEATMRHPTAEDWDHERDLRKHEPRPSDLTTSQRVSIAKLIGAMEGVISSGILHDHAAELELRSIVADALAAFGLPSQRETSGGVL